jgi:hypothetical protein
MSARRPTTSRRQFLELSAGAAGSLVSGVAPARVAPRIELLDTRVISLDVGTALDAIRRRS